MREASVEITSAIPENGNSRPEFVNDMMAETRLIVQLAHEMREAAADGNTSDAAKKLKDKAKKEKANNSDKDKPKSSNGQNP